MIGVAEEILHTAGDEVALLAGESHGGTRLLLVLSLGSFPLLVGLGQSVFLQSGPPSQVDLAGLTAELPSVDAEVILEIVFPLCHKITLVAHKIDILSRTGLIESLGDPWVDFLHV